MGGAVAGRTSDGAVAAFPDDDIAGAVPAGARGHDCCGWVPEPHESDGDRASGFAHGESAMSKRTRRRLITTGIAAAAGASGVVVAAKLAKAHGLIPPDSSGI